MHASYADKFAEKKEKRLRRQQHGQRTPDGVVLSVVLLHSTMARPPDLAARGHCVPVYGMNASASSLGPGNHY
jgi:hypothetical protein